jgi:hypothetical protein
MRIYLKEVTSSVIMGINAYNSLETPLKYFHPIKLKCLQFIFNKIIQLILYSNQKLLKAPFY